MDLGKVMGGGFGKVAERSVRLAEVMDTGRKSGELRLCGKRGTWYFLRIVWTNIYGLRNV